MTKHEALQAATVRAREAGSQARGFALRPFMTDEERAAYDAAPRSSDGRFFGTWQAAYAHFGRKPVRANDGLMAFGGEAHWM